MGKLGLVMEFCSPKEAVDEEGGKKRRRDKKEKIEWKAEAGTKSKPREGSRDDKEPREEKRRKGRDGDRVSDRHDREHERSSRVSLSFIEPAVNCLGSARRHLIFTR